jgi:hypothetical protein
MMRRGLLVVLRRTSVIALVSLYAIPTASALASDPLLSGYAGPGGGEQIVIGTKVLPPANGDGGLRQASLSGSSSGNAPAKKKREKKKAGSSDAPATTGSKPVYPTEASTAAGLPLASGDLLVLLVGAGAVGLIAFFFSRNRPTDQ